MTASLPNESWSTEAKVWWLKLFMNSATIEDCYLCCLNDNIITITQIANEIKDIERAYTKQKQRISSDPYLKYLVFAALVQLIKAMQFLIKNQN